MAASLSISSKQNSQSISNNTSNVTVTVVIKWTYQSHNLNNRSGTLTIDGESYSFSKPFNTGKSTSGSQTLFTKTVDVEHNNDGTKKVYYSASYSKDSDENITASSSRTLTNIIRKATLLTAEDFNDNENPVITYSNPAGDAVDSLQACISFTGFNDDIVYRDIPKTGSNLSYTFNLSTSERNTLRNYCNESNSKTVKFYLRTTIGETDYYSILDKTLTVIDANPTIVPTIIDTNNTTIALTGDTSTLIKYHSNALATINPTVYKGATISSKSIKNGDITINELSNTFYNVTNSSFLFTVKDSRKNSVSLTIDKNTDSKWLNYVPLTCNVRPTNPSTNGSMTLDISGNYWNGNFGAVANNLIVQYRKTIKGIAFGDWINATTIIINNTYSSSILLTGLDYQTTYSFEVRAIDQLSTTPTRAFNIQTMPMFDWGQNDFAFNVPVSIAGTATISNSLITPKGGYVCRFNSNGVDGYFKICKITNTSSYQNQVLSFNIIQRNRSGKIKILCNSNVNAGTLTVNNIIKEGNINVYYINTNNELYIYIEKSDADDDVLICNLEKGPYMNGTTITWLGDTISSLPGGYGTASDYLLDTLYPIDSIYIESNNTNPSTYLGGTWVLTDKEFESWYGAIDGYWTDTNTDATNIYCVRNGHSIRIRFNLNVDVALADTKVELGKLNLLSLGITDLLYVGYVTGAGDAANNIAMIQIYNDGTVYSLDTVPDNITANNALGFEFTAVIPKEYMIDSYCNKFYWKRTA